MTQGGGFMMQKTSAGKLSTSNLFGGGPAMKK